VSFFFSVLSNATVWPLVWVAVDRTRLSICGAVIFWVARILTAIANQRRLTQCPVHWTTAPLVLFNDLAGFVIWALASSGNRIEWRGKRYRTQRDGKLRLEQVR